MTPNELYQYMQQPNLLSSATLGQLKDLVEAYPYCPTFVFLYLYNLSITEDVRYTSELRRYALLLPDRAKLFRLVEAKDIPPVLSPYGAEQAKTGFDLVDSYLEQMKTEGEDLPTELSYTQTQPIGQDYFAWVETSSETDSQQTDLSSLVEPSPADKSPVSSPSSLETTTEDVGEALFTETLAKIYIQQGHYAKALRIIRSISLNYPEKNRYFADQIRFLELLIKYGDNGNIE